MVPSWSAAAVRRMQDLWTDLVREFFVLLHKTAAGQTLTYYLIVRFISWVWPTSRRICSISDTHTPHPPTPPPFCSRLSKRRQIKNKTSNPKLSNAHGCFQEHTKASVSGVCLCLWPRCPHSPHNEIIPQQALSHGGRFKAHLFEIAFSVIQ